MEEEKIEEIEKSKEEKNTYSPFLGFVYTFNLIIGVGALSMPHGFQLAGIFLSTLLLLAIAFCAYVSVTFVIETLACANALQELTAELEQDETMSLKSSDESGSYEFSVNKNVNYKSESIFAIKRRYELGTMAQMFCGKKWEMVFYVILIVYLYGDLAIYAVAVPSSLKDLANEFIEGETDSTDPEPKWIDNLYYLSLLAFSVCILPFCFFDFQKTKYLQYATITLRNVSMLMIVVLSFIRMGKGKPAKLSNLRYFSFGQLPNLFGTVIYSFMCHHSLPSIVTPVKDKRNIFGVMAATYSAVLFVYGLLNYSTLLAFGDPCQTCFDGNPCKIDDLITETFSNFSITFISVFLTLYPVFTLSTNYPLIAITLRNNLMNVITYGSDGPYARFRPPFFACLASVPPIIIAFGTQNVYKLVNITGAYGGVGIQWFIPVLLVYYARKRLNELAPGVQNPHTSIFNHDGWLIGLMVLVVVSVIISTFNLIYDAVGSPVTEVTCDIVE